MYYLALAVFVTLLVFFGLPNLKKTQDKEPDQNQYLKKVQQVDYTPPKREPPKRTQGGASRLKDEDVPNQR